MFTKIGEKTKMKFYIMIKYMGSLNWHMVKKRKEFHYLGYTNTTDITSCGLKYFISGKGGSRSVILTFKSTIEDVKKEIFYCIKCRNILEKSIL